MSDRRTIARWTEVVPWMAVLAIALSAIPVGASEIEVSGTLLCRPEGDPRRERPVDSPCLVVEPAGFARATELVDEAGLFRVRVPEDRLDRMLVLQVRSGSETVDLIRVFLDSRRLLAQKRYVLDAHSLPGDCSALVCLPGEALAVRDRLRAPPPPGASLPSLRGKPKWLAFLLAPALLAFGAGDNPSDADLPGHVLSISVDTLAVVDESSASPQPDEWPSYARSSSSPALGRSLTMWRDPAELAFWNPSALALARRSGAAVGIGWPLEVRGSGWVQLPAGNPSRIGAPFALSAAVVVRGADRPADLHLADGTTVESELANEERLFLLGGAASPWPRVSFGAALRVVSSRRDVVRNMTRTTAIVEAPDSTQYEVARTDPLIESWKSDATDFDLSGTWDLSATHRLAFAVHHVLDHELRRPDGTKHSPREEVLGYEAHAGRLHAGLEVALHEEDLDVAGGANYRVANALSLDASAASRFQAWQAGADLHRGRLTLRTRLRWDRFDSAGGLVSLDVGG